MTFQHDTDAQRTDTVNPVFETESHLVSVVGI